MAGHDHAAGLRDVFGGVVVDEAPRPDERALALREAATDRHRSRAAERHLAVGQDDGGRGGRVVAADDLGGVAVRVAHPFRLGPEGALVAGPVAAVVAGPVAGLVAGRVAGRVAGPVARLVAGRVAGRVAGLVARLPRMTD